MKMNVVLTRSSQRHLNFGWEPSATSTPLKIVPNNVNVEKEYEKEFQIRTDSLDIIRKLQKSCTSTNISLENPTDQHLVTKRLRKNKSCTNFDFSSSDEDSANEKKRPVIKLSFKKQANLLLSNKKSDVEDIKAVENTNTTDNYQSITETKKTDFKSLKENFNMHDGNKKKQKVIKDLNSDEESLIFDKIKNSGNVIKLNSERKENTEKYVENDENFKHSNKCKFKIIKSKKASKRKQETDSFINRKFKNIEGAVNSVKVNAIKNKNAQNKSGIQYIKKSRDDAVALLERTENKSKTSHQLFSDSREQELINILDLTSEEVSEAKESNNFLYQNKNKLICTSFISLHPSNHTNFSEKLNDDDISKEKHSLKKHQFTKNISAGQFPATTTEKQYKLESNLKILKSSNEEILEPHLLKNEKLGLINKGVTQNISGESNLSIRKTNRKKKKTIACKITKKKERFNTANDSINKIKLSNRNGSNVKSNLDSKGSITKNHTAEEGKTTALEKPVFKLINELSYNEDEAGCSAVECWNVNNFKCGVFKLKINAHMNCTTLHKNSHLGGVLVRGNLRMKIGSKELDLSQGDMAFVPPLTEWQTTNIGVCESVFYYWCGRFKI